MSKTISPLAPVSYAVLPPVEGVRMATAEAGIRYKNRKDVLLMLFDAGTTAAGVFTRSKCPSAAVDWCRAHIHRGTARALVVNSGNANAFTGLKGVEAVTLTANIAAKSVNIMPHEVFLASTGVIGEPLDAYKFDGVLQGCAAQAKPDQWLEAAKAIMTTDTFPKVATRQVKLAGVTITINGIAKGSGMIAPDMATMLAYVVTDAAIAAPLLQNLLKKGTDKSFNCVTVDGDTSTSDSLMLFATGAAAAKGAPVLVQSTDTGVAAFGKALNDLLIDLAQQVARDGEGARKFVTIRVTGAKNAASAHKIAMSMANSPLVKTAIAGEDANWGRIVMAVGKAGEPAERDRLAIFFGPYRVAFEGARDMAYNEVQVSNYMKSDTIEVRVDLGLGKGSATVWTCDLTKGYVEINGDYRS
jgi:glutamate N-acetyltransferase / amino-acid N-acetyltransferase